MIFFAVPFFKNVFFLEETLQSLITQNSPNWCAIVLDDSIDSSESHNASACVQKFSDSRIQYQKNNKNLGMANNWNQGLELGKKSNAVATTILHADDRLLPDYVGSMIKAIEKNPDAVAFFSEAAVINGLGKRTFSFTDAYKKLLLPKQEDGMIHLKGVDGISSLIPGNYIFCPTLCYRHTKIDRLFDSKLKMVTDFEFTLDLLMNNHELIGLYQKPLFEYRRHASNTTNLMNQNLERFKEEVVLYLGLAKKLEALGFSKLAHQARQLKIIKKNLIFQLFNSILHFNFSLANRYFQFLIQLKTN